VEGFFIIMQIQIDAEFKALIPPLAPDELAQLEANILRDGCRDPLVVWDGILIDGHNRHEICVRHGIEFEKTKMEFEDREAAELWIIQNQMGRRNLENIDKVPLLERKREILAGQAKERMESGRNQHSPPVNLPEATKETRDAVAAEIGVSGKTYDALRKVSNEGTEELKQAVRDKKVGASTAAEISQLPAETQREIASLPTRKEIVEEVKKHVHVAQNSGENEWYTPPQFIESARLVMGSIDTDPASSDIANKVVGASEYFTKEMDGLSQKWRGNVWMNPPYAQPLINQFAEAVSQKLESGEIDQAIILVNNATETQWFQRMAGVASAVCFPKSRIKFLDPSGKPGAPLQGQAIIYFGNCPKLFRQEFSTYGATFA
jgi:ParB family chromosome partitioning protein